MQFLIKFWQNLNAVEKKGLVLGIVLILFLSVGLSIFIFKIDYAVLFSDLSDDDAARITEQLKSMKTNYKLDNAGSTILVDSKIVHATRLALTARGALIKGGVGFELFDKTEYGMTDFAQKINFQRALQGELTRTIMSLQSIEAARVHLSLPESSLFETENSHPKASVTVKLKLGETLSLKTIQGIQRLVSASVNGLDVNNVSVLDDNGEILSKDVDSETSDYISKIQSKKDLEVYLTKKAVTVLEGVFGAGNAIVNVDVSLDYDQVQNQNEHVLPAEGSAGVLIEKKINSTRKSKPADGKDNNDEIINDSQELKYAAGREVNSTVMERGKISRITASVVVPNNTDSRQIASLQALIGNTIGIDESRGDKIEVASIASLMSMGAIKANQKILPIDPDGSDTVKSGVPSSQGVINLLKDNRLTLIGCVVILFMMNALFILALKNRNSLTPSQRNKVFEEISKILENESTMNNRKI